MNPRTLLLLSASMSIWGQGVTFDRILHADREPQNWLTYSGSTNGQRYTALKQITPGNVKNLELQWIWQARSVEKYEATSIVVDGVLYTVQAPNDVVKLSTRPPDDPSGPSPIPTRPKRPSGCGRVNRGLPAIPWRHCCSWALLDAHLIALDAKTGRVTWNDGDHENLAHRPLRDHPRSADRER